MDDGVFGPADGTHCVASGREGRGFGGFDEADAGAAHGFVDADWGDVGSCVCVGGLVDEIKGWTFSVLSYNTGAIIGVVVHERMR